MASNNQKKNSTERKQMMTRVVCLALAGVMVITTLLAAILSQVW